jgi:TorA maturation chaperone TorD
MKLKTTQVVEVDITPELLGQLFADMDDDAQCKFFVAAAEVASKWEANWEGQFYAVGGHLRNCSCSTEDARDLVRSIARGLEHSTHN